MAVIDLPQLDNPQAEQSVAQAEVACAGMLEQIMEVEMLESALVQTHGTASQSDLLQTDARYFINGQHHARSCGRMAHQIMDQLAQSRQVLARSGPSEIVERRISQMMMDVQNLIGQGQGLDNVELITQDAQGMQTHVQAMRANLQMLHNELDGFHHQISGPTLEDDLDVLVDMETPSHDEGIDRPGFFH